MRWSAVITAAVAYWVLGFLWYSVFFGRAWAAGLKEHGVKMPEAGGKQLGANMLSTFLCNLLAAAAIDYLVRRTGMTDLRGALRLGAVAGVGFAATSITVSYIWESKPTKIWAIDAIFHIVGCLGCALIVALWP